MNQPINLPSLISKISVATGISPADVRRFLHELFATVEQGLSSGEIVEIKGLGAFVRGADISHPVLFRPEPELAACLNEPFAAFEAVELNDGAEQEISVLPADDARDEIPNEFRSEMVAEPAEIPLTATPDQTPDVAAEDITVSVPEDTENNTSEVSDECENTAVSEDVPAPVLEPEDEEPAGELKHEPIPEEIEEEQDAPASPEQNRTLWLVAGILIGLIVGLCGGYFAGKAMGAYSLPEDFEYPETETVEESQEVVVETPAEMTETTPMPDEQMPEETPEIRTAINEPETVVTDAPESSKKAEPVYDTVTNKRYLAILAKEHYGVKNYWIFIYEANPGLGNPNKIAPGTKVLIPDKSTFEEETPQATAAKASKLIGELSRKYKF
ncbi:MAG: HU family DNA-binding protein [Muribaculaceae bacterium]|nr:HU family DNA-binding protein [Muribaculaceae bacterium]